MLRPSDIDWSDVYAGVASPGEFLAGTLEVQNDGAGPVFGFRLGSIITAMFPAIFLDRDGVLIENRPDYVRSWAEVSIYPQALKALARIRHTGYKIVIVTNQSCVGRGLVSMAVARDINRRLVTEIERAGGRIDAVRMCPHAPELGCTCRKPEPGLLLEAAHSLSLDLGRSILIGDALSDLQAGRAAGVAQVVLVQTGRGDAQTRLPLAAELQPFLVFRSLEEALEALFPRKAGAFH